MLYSFKIQGTHNCFQYSSYNDCDVYIFSTDPLLSSITLVAPPSEEKFLLSAESFTVKKQDSTKKVTEEDSDDEDWTF